MKKLTLLLALLLFAGGPLSAQEKEPAKAKEMRSPLDYLWVLELKEGESPGGFRWVLEQLEASKVPNREEALGVANKTIADGRGGILAEEWIGVTGLHKIAVDVPDFARKGDLIWVVQMTGRFIDGVAQTMWVSSSTGKVRSMVPFEKIK